MPRITIYNRAGTKITVKVGSFDAQEILNGGNASFNPTAGANVEATVPGFEKMIPGGALRVPPNSTAMDIRVEERAVGSNSRVVIGLTADPVL